MKIKIDFKKGFTILEFLVVIAIMGILMSVALFGINLSRERGRDNSRISDMQVIGLALEQYRDVCREYPREIYANPAASNGCLVGSSITWNSFIPAAEMPSDPNGSEYLYTGLQTFTGQGRCIGYHLGTELEQEGNKYLQTDDDGVSSTGSTPRCVSSNVGFDGEDSSTSYIYDVIKLK